MDIDPPAKANRWLYVSTLLAIAAAVALGFMLGRVGSGVLSNCEEVENLKALIRQTFTDSRDSALARNLDPEAERRIRGYYDRELARYAERDCGL